MGKGVDDVDDDGLVLLLLLDAPVFPTPFAVVVVEVILGRDNRRNRGPPRAGNRLF